jgi:hypothetical protein
MSGKCETCGHEQSGYPEGYCERLVRDGPAPEDLDVCACTNDIHSDHPHQWENDPGFTPFCTKCGSEQEWPTKAWSPD